MEYESVPLFFFVYLAKIDLFLNKNSIVKANFIIILL